VPLAEYLEEDMGQSPDEAAGNEEPRYCFVETGIGSGDEIKELIASIERPAFFQDTERFNDQKRVRV
jgi:hypothetical protein